MTRDHRKAGVIRVTCTDSFHHDEPGYEELGHHHIGTLRLAYRKGFPDAGFRWHGPREPMSLPGTPLTELPLPVKMWRTEDDKFVWRFRCTCGRDLQLSDTRLAQIATRWAKLKPDTPRVLLDITRL